MSLRCLSLSENRRILPLSAAKKSITFLKYEGKKNLCFHLAILSKILYHIGKKEYETHK